jgi:hypothetical protein
MIGAGNWHQKTYNLAHKIYPVCGEKMPEPAAIFPYATGNGLSGSLRKKLMQIAGGLVCTLTNALRCLPVVVVV